MPLDSSETLLRVSGVDAKHLVAVGEHGTVARFDGSEWTVLPSSTHESLLGVAMRAPDSIVAVGRRGGIWRYDGTRWQSVPSPTSLPLYDVWLDQNGAGYAAGDEGVLRLSDGVWTLLQAPESVRFRTLVRHEGELLALGAGAQGEGRAFSVHSRAWTRLEMPWPKPVNAVSFHHDLFVLGGPRDHPLLGTLHQGTWSMHSAPGGSIADLWATDGALYVLSHNTATAHAAADILAFNGQTWSTEWHMPGAARLHDMWSANSCDIFAVGDQGLILRR